MKGKDIVLIPEADGAQFIKPTDGARQAFKGWARGRDAFQITAVGMHKIAEAERRAFRLKAEQSEQEAELLRRDGNLDRAKKFLEQETKWRAKMAQSDEAIYKDYKAQGRDSRGGIGKNTVKMAHEAGEFAKKDAIAKGASKEEAQAAYQKVYMATLAQLLSGGSTQAKDGILSSPPTKAYDEGRFVRLSEARLTAAVKRAKKAYETARGRVGTAEEARKMRGQRIQSAAEQKARSRASELYREVYTAERLLKEFQESTSQAKDGLLSSPLLALAALLAIFSHFNKETVGPSSYDLRAYRPPKRNW